MNHIKTLILVSLSLLLLSGCGQFTKQEVPIPTSNKIDQDKVRIKIVRPFAHNGGAIAFALFDGDKKIGTIGNDSTFIWDRPIGIVKLTSKHVLMGITTPQPGPGVIFNASENKEYNLIMNFSLFQAENNSFKVVTNQYELQRIKSDTNNIIKGVNLYRSAGALNRQIDNHKKMKSGQIEATPENVDLGTYEKLPSL